MQAGRHAGLRPIPREPAGLARSDGACSSPFRLGGITGYPDAASPPSVAGTNRMDREFTQWRVLV